LCPGDAAGASPEAGVTSAKGSFFRDVMRVARGDRVPTALLFLWFLLIICAYYVVRPVRSTLVLFSLGPEVLPWVYMGTAAATGVAVWVFAKFSRVPRRQLVGWLLLFFVANLLFWWWAAGQAVAARAGGDSSWDWTSPLFYVWTDVFSSMSVTVFWMVANDLFGPAGAKRTFGILAAAGPAGGFLGAWVCEELVPVLGPVHMVLVAALVFAAAAVVYAVLEGVVRGRSAHRRLELPERKAADLRNLPAVVKKIASSRFLLFLTLVVCLERAAPDFVDWIFQTAGMAVYDDPTAWTAFFAAFEKWRELLVLVATFFVTSPLLVWGGPTWALASVPICILLFSGAFAVVPLFAFAVALKGCEEGQRHAWFKAGKELTYTVTSRDVIYSVKGYIEVFLYRFSRGVAGLLLLGLTLAFGLGPQGVAAATLPLALVWLWAIRRLGREFRREEQKEGADGG
jgi:AAA family ATP:ADP antiporter